LTVPPRPGSVLPPGDESGAADEPASAQQRGMALGMFAEDIG